MKNLDPNKSYGHDEIFVKMLKLCAPSVCKPLSLVSENFLASGQVATIHKIGDKKLIKNYRPVSLLPIFRKLLGKRIFSLILNSIESRNIISVRQSVFRLREHKMCASAHFDCSWYLQCFWCQFQLRSDRCFSWYLQSIW